MKEPLHPYLDYSGILAFAHRGGAEEYPENTMRAFSAAVDMGYCYLETDAHLTADGKLLAFHDDCLDRVTDGEGKVSDLPWAVVRQSRVAGSEPIVQLEELLESFPCARFNIDIKAWPVLLPTLHLVHRMGIWDRVCIGSFSDLRLGRVRNWLLGGGRPPCTSMGPMGVMAIKAKEFGLPARTGAQCAQVPVRHWGMKVVTKEFVEAAHSLNVQVHVWTIDDPVEMRKLIDLGVDGLMTDKPSVLKQVLVDMGKW